MSRMTVADAVARGLRRAAMARSEADAAEAEAAAAARDFSSAHDGAGRGRRRPRPAITPEWARLCYFKQRWMLSRERMDKMVSKGLIRPPVFCGGKHARWNVADVERVFAGGG